MDIAHTRTDALILQMEHKLKKEYAQAVIEVDHKLKVYMSRFEAKNKKWLKDVADGKKTIQEYKQWKIGQIAVGKRWEEMKTTLAMDYHNANMIAESVIRGYMPEVYALNHNYATYEVEHDALVDTSYTLYDRQTAERLMRDNPTLLPPPGNKTAKRIAAKKDILWNKQQIQSVMMQSLLQGESIPKIARRLAVTVGETNLHAAVRNARTMATGAQNAGRKDAYKRAQDMGIDVRNTWVAALDGRTRHAHRILDGQTQPIDKPFEVEGQKIMYPGDPTAHPSLVYNCRCTLIAQIRGFERDTTAYRRDPVFGGMSYDEWKQAKPTRKQNGSKNNKK